MAEIHVEQKRRGSPGWLWLLLVLLLAGAAYWFWSNRERTSDVTVPAAAGASSAIESPRPALSRAAERTHTEIPMASGGMS